MRKKAGRPRKSPTGAGAGTYANGTAATPPAAPSTARSSSQPRELSDADKERLRHYLSNNDAPFSVATVPLSRKRKRATALLLTETDLFEDRLSVQYEVKPANNWESLRRYKRFTVGSESIAVGECVLVEHNDSEQAKIDIAAQWKAKVLEVRALDPEHVYLRVAWLNRPEDLASGRKSYHGKNELIPTNQMDIIDAMSVNGRLELYHWREGDDESPMPGSEEYFWRQTYDIVNTKTYSQLHQICVDEAPQNPDELILQCANPECRKWLHVKCIAEDAVARATQETPRKRPKEAAGSTPSKARAPPQAPSISPQSAAQAKAQNDTLTAEVFVKGLPDGPNRQPAARTEIVVTPDDGERQVEPVRCLFCREAIE